MKPLGTHNYFVYIITNKNKTVLYIGVTQDLKERLYQHKNDVNKQSFTYKYNVNYLIYFERFQYVEMAIDREKQLKKWSRKKKENIINEFNPEWNFLNDVI